MNAEGGRALTADQFAAMLGGMAEGVAVQDSAGQWVYANEVAARLSGYPSGEAMLAATVASTIAHFQLLAEDGGPFPLERLPARQVLAGQDESEAVVRFRSLDSGQERWSIVSATPIRDDQGHVQLVVSIFRDITERKRVEDAARFLAAASRLLAESLDVEVTLQQVADLAVPTLADWCVVDLVEDRGVRRIALAHVDPHRLALARELQERYPEDPDAPAGVANVLKTGRPEVLQEITDEMIEAGARDAEHLRLLRELRLRSYLIVPMVARGHTLGAITLVAAESGRHYRQTDLTLADELGARAALALDNARLYREAQDQAEVHVLLNAALRESIGQRDEAVHRLEELLRTREEFLASAAHDLKNPLANIKSNVQLLERRARSSRPPDPERLADTLHRIDGMVSRAAAEVDELLDTTRLQMGQALELDRAPMDMVALVRERVAEYAPRSSRHQIHLDANPVEIEGQWDTRRLNRVVGNLLDNAIRYSPDGGLITVTLRHEGEEGAGTLVMSIQDSGVGIPANDLPLIFERFHRAANVRGRIAGTGVGLASACSIVQAHGGTINVDSLEGSGSTFFIRLPLAVGADQTAARAGVEDGEA